MNGWPRLRPLQRFVEIGVRHDTPAVQATSIILSNYLVVLAWLVTLVFSAGFWFWNIQQPLMFNAGISLLYAAPIGLNAIGWYLTARLVFILLLETHIYVNGLLFMGPAAGSQIYLLLIPVAAYLLFRMDEAKMKKARHRVSLALAIVTALSLFVYGVYGSPPLHYREAIPDAAIVVYHFGSHVSTMLIFLFIVHLYNDRIIKDRARIEKANRIKTDIIAKVNHELNVPALGIQQTLAIARGSAKNKKSPEEQDALLERCVSYSRYLRTLIDNMMYATALEVKAPFYVAPGEIAALQEAWRFSLDLSNDTQNARIEFPGPAPDVMIAAPEEILRIILVNLLANCAEHARKVEIRWEIAEGQAILRCENDIVTPFDVQSIFESWTSSREDGTRPILGLGLNITRFLVEEVGGELTAWEANQRFIIQARLPLSTE
ncbi:MAG: hypothetical protein NXI24_05275 [bacterium]|nr:hypothetical protein [bacterium]